VERAELARLRNENCVLWWEKDFFSLAVALFATEQLPPSGFVDQPVVGPLFRGLALLAARRGPQRLLRLAVTTAQPGSTGPAERGHHGPASGRGVERQPVLRIVLQDSEVPPRLPQPSIRQRGDTSLWVDTFELAQPSASPHRIQLCDSRAATYGQAIEICRN